MGVIQDHPIGRFGFQQFDAPRHVAHAFQAPADVLSVNAQGAGHARGEQGVIYVEDARQLQGNGHPEMPVIGQHEAAAPLTDFNIVGVHFGSLPNAHAEGRPPQGRKGLLGGFVIGVVDDLVRHFRRKEGHFRRQISVHGAEIVQMILREIGERAHSEAHAVQPVHGQGVGRDLHHHVFRALVQHVPQQGLHLQRIRRGELGGNHFVANHGAHGADVAGFVARGLDYRLHQVTAGGLSLGAGKAHQFQMIGGISVKVGCDNGSGLAHAAHLHLGAIDGQMALHNQRRRSRLHRLRRKVVRVHPQTGGAEKQRTPLHLPGIDAQIVNFHLGVAVNRNNIRYSLKQCAQFHRKTPCCVLWRLKFHPHL